MANVFIFHGTEGSPEINWFPWLKKELEGVGVQVFTPRFPTPEGQNLENWLAVLKPYEKELNADSILVGHSMGACFILNYLEQSNHPVKAAFLVAGWNGLLEKFPGYTPLIESFTGRELDWNALKLKCGKFYAFHGDDDPYVPLQMGKDLAGKVGAEFHPVKGGGHLNYEKGFTTFPLLLEKVKEEL